MSESSSRRLAGLVLALGLFAVGGVACDGSNASGADQDEEARAKSAQKSGKSGEEPDEAKDAPPADRYSVGEYSQLGGGARAKFVEVAKSELCPCPDVEASLDKCLSEEAKRCPIAERAARLMTEGLKGGLSKTDVRSRLAEFAESAKRQHNFTLEGVPHKGPKDAPVRIVEFADFQCPHCKRAASMLKEVKKEFGSEVVHYFKHFPLPGHDKAELAARATHAAHQQGKFWEMHDLAFKHQKSLSKEKIQRFARRLGLNFSKFKKDMNGARARKVVQRDKKEASNAEISGTPAIFINGRRHMGEKNKAAVSAAVRAALERSKAGEGKKDKGKDEKSGGDAGSGDENDGGE